jgi:putative Mg2+ transporter-C (MgtC) family protein
MTANDWWVISYRLFLALVLGGVIGLERQIRHKSAGLRTHMMVSLGAALFMEISILTPSVIHAPNADPTRIAAQIITGIGFLGAGTILHSRGLVIGLTTAASIWLSAAIGMAVAVGLDVAAGAATALGLLVLALDSLLERFSRPGHRQGTTVRCEIDAESRAPEVRAALADLGASLLRFQLATDDRGSRIELRLEMTDEQREALVGRLQSLAGIRRVEVER